MSDPLERLLDHLGHRLPAQAPLEVFVHHNTLHAFQHLPFHQALEAAAAALGSSGYLGEERYREAFWAGRIAEQDLQAALERWVPPGTLPAWPAGLPDERALVRLLLLHPPAPMTAAGLAWQMSERRAVERFAPGVLPAVRQQILRASADRSRPRPRLAEASRGPGAGDDAHDPEANAVGWLWSACVALVPPRAAEPAVRQRLLPRDAVLAAGGDDPSDLVHPLLILLSGAFLDRGQSHWPMPDREHGFLVAFRRILGAGHAIRPSWLATLGLRLRAWEARGASATQVIGEMLQEIGVADEQAEAFLEATLLSLPGWAGMFHRLEAAPAAGASPARVRLSDFLAVRLILDALALAEVGRRLGHRGPLRELRAFCASLPALAAPEPAGSPVRAWPLFWLAQHAGLSAPALQALPREAVGGLLSLLARFDEGARRRLWHEAYEGHYREELLGALGARRRAPAAAPEAARLQVILCIDDRNESLRRHIEELDPAHETFGTAGFFNLAIAYQGIDDPSTFPLCPVVVTPSHTIEEVPEPEDARLLERRRRRLKQAGFAAARFRQASGSLLLGPLVTALAGALSALPMLAGVFAPRLAGRLRSALRQWLLPAPRTHLSLPALDGGAGFTLEEKAQRVGTLLRNLGMVRGFARLVAVVGHDSSSVNNPHFAAYSCGACGGRSGGPNARLFARMANRPEVRERLRQQGIDIPGSTWFVGGVHDTCADRIRLFDAGSLPGEAQRELGQLSKVLDEACRRNAHERCRRFASAPRELSFDEAHRHVEGRSLDLSQARPELGHATNASCVVGRRALTRGLFLDRRAFLVSYDPTDDPSGEILERILLAVGPVGAGINLEYFFSTTDGERYGAGTKLPHNVTGLVGVMNGASSDLRTGLPRQMIEIHEPVRLQLVVEAEPELLASLLSRQPSVRELVGNAWVQLISVHPDTGQMALFDAERGFVPRERGEGGERPLPRVTRSADWYRGKEGFVAPALIGASTEAHHAG